MTATTRRLDEVCAITMGQAPPGDSYNTIGEGLPLIAGAGDFAGERPAVKKFTTAATKVCDEGDVVLGIRASIGAKVWADGRYCLGRGVAGLRPGPNIDVRFLWHWLSSSANALAAKGRGATFLQVNRRDIGEMQIQVPPLDEQRRIAAILDGVEELRENRRHELRRIDDLERSIFLHMFGDGGRDRGEIASVPLSSLVEKVTYGFTNPMAHVPCGVPIVTARSIRDNRIDLIQGHFTTREDFEALSSKSRPRHGDVLVTKDGTIGRCAVVREEGDFCINQSVALVRPRLDLVDPTFLLGYLTTARVQAEMNGMGKGNALKHLQITELSKMLVPSPGKDLQQDYASRMRQLGLVRKQSLEALSFEVELSEVLLVNAFSGQP